MNSKQATFNFNQVFNITVIVAALGYFVDVYDLVLFLIIGVKSLKDLFPQLSQERIVEKFQYLLNVQMIGMLLGGIFWGVLADKKGRLSVLFSCIIMYSIANIFNGLIVYINLDEGSLLTSYALLRFIAGVGLAGELGVGITLVSEIMDKQSRGYGTMIVASVGVVGAVVAGLLGASNLGWEITYYVGGGLGIALLLLRIGVLESGLFKNIKEKNVERGNFFLLFNSRKRLLKYLNCILVGLPVWYIIGILVGRAFLIAEALNVKGIEPGYCVSICYTGLVFGDILSVVLSQALRSRKKVFYIFYSLCIITVTIYLQLFEVSSFIFYSIIFFLGISVGFWAVLVTIGSELFGTNIRATAATTVPNFIRGSLVPVALAFDFTYKYFKSSPAYSNNAILWSVAVVTGIVMLISFISLYFLEETFGKELDYIEEDLIP